MENPSTVRINRLFPRKRPGPGLVSTATYLLRSVVPQAGARKLLAQGSAAGRARGVECDANGNRATGPCLARTRSHGHRPVWVDQFVGRDTVRLASGLCDRPCSRPRGTPINPEAAAQTRPRRAQRHLDRRHRPVVGPVGVVGHEERRLSGASGDDARTTGTTDGACLDTPPGSLSTCHAIPLGVS